MIEALPWTAGLSVTETMIEAQKSSCNLDAQQLIATPKRVRYELRPNDKGFRNESLLQSTKNRYIPARINSKRV
jgi:hypothetical protein